MGSVEDPDFAKQNDRDPAASPLAHLPTKLLKEGFNVPPRQTAAYRPGEDQLKGALVLPLHSLMVLPPGTRCGCLSTVFGIRITLNGWFPGTTTPSLPLSVNHLSDGVVILAAAAAFRQLRPSRKVDIGSDIHLVRSLREIGWANDAHRPAL